jgi:hypothetical protein
MDNEINTSTGAPQQKEEMEFGPIIGILIIVIIFAIGGFYYWQSSLQGPQEGALPTDPNYSGLDTQNTTEEYTMTDAEFDTLLETSSEETTDVILDATLDDLSDLDSLDAELNALEAEL